MAIAQARGRIYVRHYHYEVLIIMQRSLTFFHLAFTLLFAIAAIWVLVEPSVLLGKFSPRSAQMAAQQAGFGLLLAAGVSLFCALKPASRALLHPLLGLYLAGMTISYVSGQSSAQLWHWLPLALFVLPLFSLLPLRLPAGPLKAGELQGEVKWFNPNKGYGFILSDEGQEIFVHFRAVQNGGRRSLRQGQKVRFTLRAGERGEQADNVRILD
jgi:cold shock CspA family protein